MVENEEKSAMSLRVAKPAYTVKDVRNDIQDQIAVISSSLANEEKSSKQTFKKIESSSLGNKTAASILTNIVPLACDQLDDQKSLNTSLEL